LSEKDSDPTLQSHPGASSLGLRQKSAFAQPINYSGRGAGPAEGEITLELIQARAALEGLPFECTATLRVGRSVDKGHLPAALRADKPIINTDGVWLFRGHNSSRNFQDGSAIVSQPPDA